VNVRVEPIPLVDLGDDTVFKCLYQPVYITASVGPSWFSQYNYTWKPNIFIDKPTSPIITYTGNEDTTLMVLVRTPLGCANIDSTRIHVFPGNFGTLSPIDPEMCPRNAVTLTAGGGVKYQWSPALYLSNTNTPVVSSEPVTSTTYTVFVTDKHGCVDTLHTTVTVHPDGTVVLPDTVVLYPGESYQISPQGNLLYYSWFPTVGLSPNASVSNPVASPTVNTRYYVTGTTEAGCKATDSVYFLVREESAIGMSNAFSPGSEPNPVFKVSHLGTATLKAFRIYNRWGAKVFETSNINEGWDGTFNGEPQPMGVYVYTVEAQSNTGKPFVKQGNVTLLR
jgi:gliding motility-associated-like protein